MLNQTALSFRRTNSLVRSSPSSPIAGGGCGGQLRPPSKLPPLTTTTTNSNNSNRLRDASPPGSKSVAIPTMLGSLRQSGATPSTTRDRLRRLPNAPLFASDSQCAAIRQAGATGELEGVGTAVLERATSATNERRLQFLECSITFLRDQHADMLRALHEELDSAKRQIQGSEKILIILHSLTFLTD